jgi:hypothetical protein
MPTTQYIGSRYVPLLADPVEWSNTKEYEPLTIVRHEGNSYTSRQFVPVGIDISNETYWALTGNYDAQVEQYRRETAMAKAAADAAQAKALESLEVNIRSFATVAQMQADTSLKDGMTCYAKGYTTENDANSSLWSIANDALADTNVTLSNGLIASLIDYIENEFDPDNFVGTDSQKLQAAFDAVRNIGGCIHINRKYNLSSDVKIGLQTDWVNAKIYVIGNANNAGFALNGYKFISYDTENIANGGVVFQNVFFEGDRNISVDNQTQIVFGGEYKHLIRMQFDNCIFRWLKNICYYTNINDYLQTWYFNNCWFRGVKCAIDGTWIIDMLIDGCVVENNSTLISQNGTHACEKVRIINSCLEGASGKDMIKFDSSAACLIQNKYFEVLRYCVVLTNVGRITNLNIKDNYVVSSTCEALVKLPTTQNSNFDINAVILGNSIGGSTKLVYTDNTTQVFSGILADGSDDYPQQFSGSAFTNLLKGAYLRGAGRDINAIVTTGAYGFPGVAVVNGPESDMFGILLVFYAGASVLQLYVKYNGALWVRTKTTGFTSDAWNSWVHVGA